MFSLVISFLTWYMKLSSLHTYYVPCVTDLGKTHLGIKKKKTKTKPKQTIGLLFEKKNSSIDCIDTPQ